MRTDGFLQSDAGLQRRLTHNIKEITSNQRDPDSHNDPKNTYPLYRRVVGPMLSSFTHEVAQAILVATETQFRDLFVWAVLVGDDDFAFEFWKRTENPIRVALWGSFIARDMADKIQHGKQECLERGVMFEEWAIGLLDAVPTQAAAHKILSNSVRAPPMHLARAPPMHLACAPPMHLARTSHASRAHLPCISRAPCITTSPPTLAFLSSSSIVLPRWRRGGPTPSSTWRCSSA